MKTKFLERVRELVDVDAPNLRILLKIVCCKLVMKYVERRKIEKTTGIHGGGMKR